MAVPNIFNTLEDAHWKEPVIEERFDPDRTILTLEFMKKQAKKASEEKQAKKASEKASDKKQAIKTKDIAELSWVEVLNEQRSKH